MKNKVPVCIRKDYVIFIEWFSNHPWLHVTVRTWSPQIKKAFLKDLQTVFELLNYSVLALVPDDNKKLNKFAHLIGLQLKTTLVQKDGKFGHIFISKGAK